MKTHGGSGGTVLLFLTSTLDGGEWLATHPCWFSPKEQALVSTGQEDGWVPELVQTLWKREKSCNAGNRTRAIAHRYIH
jgi:hypothetical protein